MDAIPVSYDSETDTVTVDTSAAQQDWQEVCDTFFGDVHRLRDAQEHPGTTGLYVCYDDDNRPHHFLVAEGDDLQRLKRRTFLKKLGKLE
ncbi:MAG: hypothetical protein ABIL58_25015 [Pseudomonadota bacterium]